MRVIEKAIGGPLPRKRVAGFEERQTRPKRDGTPPAFAARASAASAPAAVAELISKARSRGAAPVVIPETAGRRPEDS